MPKTKVVIVDDSQLVRDIIKALISEDEEIDVVAEASDGRDAFDKILKYKPDIATIDVEMPLMNGIELIEKVMAVNPIPILVLTSKGDANTAYKAISKGALEVVQKPDAAPETGLELIEKIKLLAKVKVISHLGGRSEHYKKRPEPSSCIPAEKPQVVTIASSTGGPKALGTILSELPENFDCPILIAQHIPQDFTSGLTEWLNKICRLKIKIGEEGEVILPGTAYISPSEKHMIINSDKKIELVNHSPGDIYFPSCDRLMNSVAGVFGSAGIGVILTGMAKDGVRGMAAIKDAGGTTIAQDEETSVVFSMPGNAIKYGCIDRIHPIHEISSAIKVLCRRR